MEINFHFSCIRKLQPGSLEHALNRCHHAGLTSTARVMFITLGSARAVGWLHTGVSRLWRLLIGADVGSPPGRWALKHLMWRTCFVSLSLSNEKKQTLQSNVSHTNTVNIIVFAPSKGWLVSQSIFGLLLVSRRQRFWMWPLSGIPEQENMPNFPKWVQHWSFHVVLRSH